MGAMLFLRSCKMHRAHGALLQEKRIQNRILPMGMSLNITQSPAKE